MNSNLLELADLGPTRYLMTKFMAAAIPYIYRFMVALDAGLLEVSKCFRTTIFREQQGKPPGFLGRREMNLPTPFSSTSK
jgi:hypothetical protein